MSDDRSPTWRDHLGSLAAPATVVVAAAIAWGLDHRTPERQRAIGFAAATCLVGGVAAWLVGLRPGRSPAERVSTGLAPVALRLLPALAALAWLQTSGSALRAAGAGHLLLVFYLAALAVDLARIIMGPSRRGGGPRDTQAI
ncbi:MAG: hypothetical protein ACKO4Z_13835 [Planctomycetota bacterium]